MSKYAEILGLTTARRPTTGSKYGVVLDEISNADAAEKDLEALFGETVEPRPKPEYTNLQKAIGAGENILNLLTGATTGAAGHLAGTVAGIPKSMIDGDYGSPEGVATTADAANSVASLLTYEPRTEAGKDYQGEVGDFYNTYGAPLEALAGLGVPQGPINPLMAARSKIPQRQSTLDGAGAASVSPESQRQANAQSLPVPFEGESALTQGQLTRDFEQLQFENEQAKIGQTGARLRERQSAQNAAYGENLNRIQEDVSGGVRYGSDYEQGQAVAGSVNAQKTADWADVGAAYDAARAQGELDMPVGTPNLTAGFGQLDTVKHLSDGVIDGLVATAKDLGMLGPDGQFLPSLSADQLIRFREVVTQNLPNTRTGKFIATKLKEGIDADMASVESGPMFKEAQAKASRFYDLYDENQVVQKVTDGDVEKSYKAIITGPTDRVTALRNNMIRSESGAAEWKGIQGRAIQELMDTGLNSNVLDINGNPQVKPAAIDKWVTGLEKSGKLEVLFDKKTQEYLFTLRDLARDAFTAPPGSINFSNTASSLTSMMTLMADGALFGATGLPLPVAHGIRGARTIRANKKLDRKIDAALNPKGIK